MLRENFRKTAIYFRKWNTYWGLTSNDEKLMLKPGKTGRYPLDFKQRIREGHYPHFDEKGIPMLPRGEGKSFFYHYTTMCSYALGQSDYYLLTGKDEHLNKMRATADYILESGIEEDGGLLLREADDEGRHKGSLSAMNQGEAMSVLCRAAEYTGVTEYEKAAGKLIVPFEKEIDKGGVVGFISKLSLPWYEEYVTPPLNHVLNGMIYSLWGLRDVYLLTGNEKAKSFFEDGVTYVKKALPLFDTGYWSYYWIPESGKNYVASMMYHNLHICQLTALYEQTGERELKNYADKFLYYTGSFLYRLRAAKDIALAKTAG